MGRRAVLRRIEDLDPAVDFREICRLMVTREFPWDMNQALSFALFRTYAVPSIGALLARTGELVDRVQKRYDDTVLILDEILEHGPTEGDGRTALRRMNRMHGFYGISDDDLRYVLSTFVVMPIRWMDAYGWRRFTEIERMAQANYYRELGRFMGIPDIPPTHQAFSRFLDDYERAHFAFDPGARRVADTTLGLLTTFPPFHLLPAPLVRWMSYALMDDRLLDAFGFPHPNRAFRAVVRTGLRARGRALRLFPPRRQPRYPRDLPQVRSYPHGYDVAALGTFPETDAAVTSPAGPACPGASSADAPAAASGSAAAG